VELKTVGDGARAEHEFAKVSPLSGRIIALLDAVEKKVMRPQPAAVPKSQKKAAGANDRGDVWEEF
jgi:hypothetical protein